MKEEMDGIYDKPKFGMIVWGFVAVILLGLVLGWLFLRTGHPAMHTTPQPKDNRGALLRPATIQNT